MGGIYQTTFRIRFTAPIQLPLTSRLEVEIAWPVRLGDEYPVHLLVKGRVVRSVEREIGLQLSSWEFRLTGDEGGAPATQLAHGWQPAGRAYRPPEAAAQ